VKPARRTQDETEGPQDGPERLCVATRTVKPLDALIRFVAGPGGEVVPDLKRRLPGRGVWVSASRSALREAIRRKAFGRGLKAGVQVPPTLVEDVEALLVRAARDGFSLANKAGLVVSGFSKVEAAIAGGQVEAVLHACDAAPDGVRKIGQALRRRHGDEVNGVPVVSALESSEMGLALGRSHVIHAALMKGPASRASLARFRALERYRDDEPAKAPRAGHPADMTDPMLVTNDALGTSDELRRDHRIDLGPDHGRSTAEWQDSERND
jgi:predicted RNA-binding protein YlxR (DUF448 family)